MIEIGTVAFTNYLAPETETAASTNYLTPERHWITIFPDMMGGEPTIDGHRITAEQMAEVWWYGKETIESIERNWPDINRGALLVCCWYVATYGTRTWKKRWGNWLMVAADLLWKDKYDGCPLPPQKGDAS